MLYRSVATGAACTAVFSMRWLWSVCAVRAVEICDEVTEPMASANTELTRAMIANSAKNCPMICRFDVPIDSKIPISCKRPRTQKTSTSDSTASPAAAAPMVAIVKMF